MPQTAVSASLDVNVNINDSAARARIEGLEHLVEGNAWKVKLTADESGILRELQSISAKISQVGKKPIKISVDTKQAATEMQALTKSSSEVAKGLGKQFKGINISSFIKGDLDKTKSVLKKQVDALRAQGKDLKIDFKMDNDGKGMLVSLQEGTKVAQQFHYALEQINGKSMTFMDQNLSTAASNATRSLDSMINKYKDLQKTMANSGASSTQISGISSLISELEAEKQSVYTTTEALEKFKKAQNDAFQRHSAFTKQARESEKLAKESAKAQRNVQDLESRMTSFFAMNDKSQNYANAAELRSRVAGLKELAKQYDSLSVSERQALNLDIAKAGADFRSFTANARQAGLVGSNAFTQLTNKAKQLGTYMLTSLSFMFVKNAIQSMVREVTDLDTALVELKKTTDGSSLDYDNFMKDARQVADTVGRTTSEITQAAAEWSRSGYTLKESLPLGEASAMYTNISEYDNVSDATTSLIATMKAYGLEASNVTSILDKFNAVGNTTSTTSQGLGDAVQRAGSALASAGNTLDESLGLIVAGNNALQNPEKVGRVLPTQKMAISVKLRRRTRPRKDYDEYDYELHNNTLYVKLQLNQSS